METEIAKILGVVVLAGFAIQQILQILDPAVMWFIARCRATRGGLPGGMTDADFKKALMTFLGLVFGAGAVAATGIRTLRFLDWRWDGPGDAFVTALAVGGGTEGANTLLKYFGYVKEARKQALDTLGVSVTITSPPVAVIQNRQFQFTAHVANAPSQVLWEVLDSVGGSIDRYSGLYTASEIPGTYRISATSPAEPTRPAITTVTVI